MRFVVPLVLLAVGLPSFGNAQPAPAARLYGVGSESAALPDTVLATGAFADRGGQTTRGTYRIEHTSAGELRLVLAADFETGEGPDLHVVLSPTPFTDTGSANALAEGAALVVAPLQRRTGEQVYVLPQGTDPAAYQSVLVHCVRYRHLYGAAPLAR